MREKFDDVIHLELRRVVMRNALMDVERVRNACAPNEAAAMTPKQCITSRVYLKLRGERFIIFSGVVGKEGTIPRCSIRK